MRVLHITVHMGGGAGKAIAGIIPDGSGDSYTVLALEKPQKAEHVEQARDRGAAVILEPAQEEFERAVRGADVVVCNWWSHPLLMKAFPLIDRIPCRLVLWSHINGCVYPYLPFDFADQFQRVVFTTPYSLDNPLWNQEQRERLRAKSALVYGIGTFSPALCGSRQDYRLRAGKAVAGYIGTVNYGKMRRDILKYYERASDEAAVTFRFVGDADPGFMEQAEKSRVGGKTVFAGYTRDVEAELLKTDIFSYLVGEDSYGTTENALLEAMAAGLPIIASKNGSMERILRDGQTGYLVETAGEYADRMKLLCGREEERRRLGVNARRFVTEQFDPEKNRERMRRLCLETLSEEKCLHRITGVMGTDPFRQFLYFAACDGLVFSDYFQCGDAGAKRAVQACKPIFRENSKASVKQFLAYHPECGELKALAGLLEEDE